jgi:ketosteroid isomerase-like protein
MKRTLALAVLAIAASPLASGQTPTPTPAKPATPDKPVVQAMTTGTTVEQDLMQLEQKLADAIVKGDMAFFGSHLADNATLTDPSGMVNTKAQLEADVKSGALKLESSQIDDMKVQTHGDAAIVTYKTTDKGKYKEMDISGEYRWIDVFVKKDGKWMIVASQGTPIRKMP